MSRILVPLLVISTLVLIPNTFAKNSCRKANMCCKGRDSSCVVQKAPINAIIEDLSDQPCYCDHACMKVGDCCADFKDYCGVKDCKLSSWGEWSACSTKCGIGKSHREREILTYPENGGKKCPHLRQNRACVKNKCHKHEKAARAVALILPSSFKTARTVNASKDIRKNLRLKYPKDPEKESSKEYCVVFEVVKSHGSCREMPKYSELYAGRGTRVCVSCEGMARRKHLGYKCRGHGMTNQITRWKSMTSNKRKCHGRWIQKEIHEGTCPCNADGTPNFIFI